MSSLYCVPELRQRLAGTAEKHPHSYPPTFQSSMQRSSSTSNAGSGGGGGWAARGFSSDHKHTGCNPGSVPPAPTPGERAPPEWGEVRTLPPPPGVVVSRPPSPAVALAAAILSVKEQSVVKCCFMSVVRTTWKVSLGRGREGQVGRRLLMRTRCN